MQIYLFKIIFLSYKPEKKIRQILSHFSYQNHRIQFFKHELLLSKGCEIGVFYFSMFFESHFFSQRFLFFKKRMKTFSLKKKKKIKKTSKALLENYCWVELCLFQAVSYLLIYVKTMKGMKKGESFIQKHSY